MAGIYNGIILHEASRITAGVRPGSGSVSDTSIPNTARNVFCGAQAAAIAFGQNNEEESFTWVN